MNMQHDTVHDETGRAAVVHEIDTRQADEQGLDVFQEALHAIALQSRLIIGAHQSAVSYIPDGDFKAAVHTHSFSKKYEKYNTYDVMPTGHGIWGLVVREKKSVRMTQDEITAHPDWKHFSNLKDARGLEHPPMTGWLAVPVFRTKGENTGVPRLTGVLQLTDKYEGDFTEDDLQLLSHFSRIIAIVFELPRTNRERFRLQEELRQFQKIESIGQLAGGVAHDFNNMVMAIIGFADLALTRLDSPMKLRLYLSEIKKAGERSATLTSQLLAFGRKQILEPKPTNLNDLVDGMEKLLQTVIRENIEVVIHSAPELGFVFVDPLQLEQAVMNLAVNAVDAMPHGGKLTIETSNVELDEAHVERGSQGEPSPYVVLAVSDTGVGMDAETLSHMFEPFFTTKPVGEGTGFGLAMVHGTVKQSGGSVGVSSEPGKGTTFKIYLPRTTGAAAPLVEATPTQTPGGSETILLVEDEALVLEPMVESLEDAGYTVVPASSPKEALEVVGVRQEPVDLVITDVVMPGMSGPALARQLLASHPETKIIFMSGYADNAITEDDLLDPGTVFFQKPFTADELRAKIRFVLDAPSEAAVELKAKVGN